MPSTSYIQKKMGIPLLVYPIKNNSAPNGVVLDTFGGAGSTLVACEQTDRICYTMELDERYATDRVRGNARERGYDAHWRRARGLFLKQNPLCAECQRNGKLTPATVVDHIVPHRGDKALFWDEKNWQPLCKSCHDKKTGFGL